jgi:hypothetical protein
MEVIEIRKSRPFGEQLNVTFAFLRENFKGLGKAVLFIVGPTAIIAGALIGFSFLDFYSLGRNGDTDNLLSSIPTLLLGVLVAFISTILLAGVVNDYVRLYLDRNGPNFTLGELWNEVKGDLGRIISTLLGLAGIVVMVYLLVVLIGVTGMKFLVVLAFIALLAFGIYAYVPLSMLITVRLCEDDGLWAAMGRCFELVKGHWWRTFGLIFVLQFIAQTISGIFVFPVQMLNAMMQLGSVGQPGTGAKLFMGIVMMFGLMLGYLLACLPYLGITLQYFNLVEKHDGLGVMARIESIGRGDEPDLNTNTNTNTN